MTYTVSSGMLNSTIPCHSDLTNQNSVSYLGPAHAGIQGNKRADRLAKQASNGLYIGPEPALPVSHMAVKSAISDWAHKKAQACWESANDCRQAKMMLIQAVVSEQDVW